MSELEGPDVLSPFWRNMRTIMRSLVLFAMSCVLSDAFQTLARHPERRPPPAMPVAAAAAAADAATKEPAARQEISGFSEAPSRWWEWRGFKIRYQELGEGNTGPAVVLVHGLFVNADHWRQNMPALAEAGCRVFAIDLLGCGYSDRPPPTSNAARAASGENGRDLTPARADLGTVGTRSLGKFFSDRLQTVNERLDKRTAVETSKIEAARRVLKPGGRGGCIGNSSNEEKAVKAALTRVLDLRGDGGRPEVSLVIMTRSRTLMRYGSSVACV